METGLNRERIRGENEWGEMFSPAPVVQLIQIPLSQLDPWEQADGSPQPFKPYSQEKLTELADSIRQHGVLEAIRVRPRNGRFQILAGHNRSEAAKLVGLTTIPAIVENVDDDQAALILVESNLVHREKLLPSEKAWAYKLQMDALKRQAGRPQKNSCQLGTNFRSDEMLAETSNDSARQIQRFIRLTQLHPVLLELVDNEKIGMTPGVELSYLSGCEQELLTKVMSMNEIQKISGKQATELRHAETLSEPIILDILGLSKKKQKPVTLQLQPNMSRYPAQITLALKKDRAYLSAIQKIIEDFTDKYIDSLKGESEI